VGIPPEVGDNASLSRRESIMQILMDGANLRCF
jgi:hypothetical protein